ncbi:MAG: hypothetical protein OJF55_001930 [Rhodanobacteraceae bacterium]|nr:MAG: hypothetical protein OJF55_001930 [Rhodanobacteraceae bacterium]
MKRDELLRRLTEGGCELMRHGGRHDIWRNPKTGQKQPIPRHREIDDVLARHIIKYLGLR